MKILEVDFDLLFYMYVCKMGMSEQDFWKSPFDKVMKLIDIYQDEVAAKTAAMNQEDYQSKYFNGTPEEAPVIYSMRDVEGFVDV